MWVLVYSIIQLIIKTNFYLVDILEQKNIKHAASPDRDVHSFDTEWHFDNIYGHRPFLFLSSFSKDNRINP